MLRRAGDTAAVTRSRGTEPPSPQHAAGEEDLVLDLVGRAPVDHDRVLVLLCQLVPHVVMLGHVPSVVYLEGMEDVGMGEVPGTPKEPRGGSSYLAGALGVPVRVRQRPPVLHRDLRGVDVLLQDLLPVGWGGGQRVWGAASWSIPPEWGDSRVGTCHPHLGHTGEGQDSHPNTTTFLRVSSLRKCLTRL